MSSGHYGESKHGKSEECRRRFLRVEERVRGYNRPVRYEGVGEHSVSIVVRTRGETIAGPTPNRFEETDKAACDVAEFGECVPDSDSAQASVVLQKIHTFCNAVDGAVQGKSKNLATDSLEGGARVHYVLQEIFVKGLCSLDPTQQLSEEDIRTAIQNAAGTKAVLLLPEEPFEILARKAIEKMSDPCHQAARLVYDELTTMMSNCVRREVSKQFPKLADAIEEATREFLKNGLEPAESMITNLVDCQLAHINTTHPDFIGGAKALGVAQAQLERGEQKKELYSSNNKSEKIWR